MRDYKHLTRFPAKDKAVLEAATEATGLSVNQIIVQSVHGHLPAILKEHERPVDLSPLPDSVIANALKQMTREEREEDRRLGRASARPKTLP